MKIRIFEERFQKAKLQAHSPPIWIVLFSCIRELVEHIMSMPTRMRKNARFWARI